MSCGGLKGKAVRSSDLSSSDEAREYLAREYLFTLEIFVSDNRRKRACLFDTDIEIRILDLPGDSDSMRNTFCFTSISYRFHHPCVWSEW